MIHMILKRCLKQYMIIFCSNFHSNGTGYVNIFTVEELKKQLRKDYRLY